MRRDRLSAGVTAGTAIALVGIAPAGVVVASMTLAYVRAAWGRRQRRDACPFEDDDDESRPVLHEVADVARESIALLRLVLSALVPVPRAWRSLAVRPGRGPLIVLLPERRLTAGSVARLGRRLAHDLDASIHVERPGSGDDHSRADRLADQLTTLAARASGRPIIVLGHGAGGRVARRAAAVLRIAGLRVVTVATAHDADRALVDRADVVNLYSLHDAIVAPPARAYLAGAFNVALRDEGHFGIVLRDHPYAILRESLDDLAPRAAAS